MKASSVSLLLGVSVLLLSGLTDSADSQVTLEIPALPVVAGSDVTLRCRTKDQVTLEAFFIRNGSKLGSGPEGQFTIRNISQSDEGLYWCYFDQTAESPRRWLSVRGPTAPSTSTCTSAPPFPSSSSSSSSSSPFSSPASPPLSPPLGAAVGSLVLLVLVLVLVGVLLLRRNQTDAVRSAQRKHTAGLAVLTAAGAAVLLSGLLVSADSSLSVLRLCCHLVVFCPYCVSTGLMLSICCSRKTGNKPAVSMEMTQRVGGSDELDGKCDDITADVITEHAF
ncbi:uncharacterized protein LOC119896233 isoform X2 [Micropterus salmoides]|uniref:uncharacterized protein LOC119896233 isoform X2 n=1 Tax=Micropterus salmoides TaxID=27706 RepID=UPI0018EB8C5E|nr:uncharacterized protein LOC119896233 isoform X2 [Micropterus salmoides]